MPYTPAYSNLNDPEKGLSPSSPTRLARRLMVLPRRPRWIISAIVLSGVLFFLYTAGPTGSEHGHGHKNGHPPPPPHHGQGGPPPEFVEGWDEGYDEGVEDHQQRPGAGSGDGGGGGGKWGGWLPFGGAKPSHSQPETGDASDEMLEPEAQPQSPKLYDFIVDENGDQFVTNYEVDIAPMHPDVSLLPSPQSLFPEIDVTQSQPPINEKYPEDQLRDIISEPESAEESGTPREEARFTIPDDAWVKSWKAPEGWDAPPEQMRKVQWEGFAGARDGWENEEQRAVRLERKEAVRRGFKHAWDAYKRHAWGHDEVKPVSKTPSDPFNGWGATIVDSLDTLLLMGFSDEYNLCRPHVNQLNFNWVTGRDWNNTYVSEDTTIGAVYAVARDKGVGLGVFETGIRYLGGLLGAYDLSGDQLLLERATDLAHVLSRAFTTKSGLPAGRIDPGAPHDEMIQLSTVSVAEVGSMSLELIRLSQITKDRKWFDLAQRAMDYLDERVTPRSLQPPLIPMWFQPDADVDTVQHGGYTFGGLADSYYEYLVKTYKLLGGTAVSQVWKRVYEASIDRAKQLLYQDITVVPDRDLLTIGKFDGHQLIHEMEHLTCFAGAMLGLGAKLLSRPGDMEDALRVTGTCYWLSADTSTGLQPEVAEWYKPTDTKNMYHNVSLEDGLPYHQPVKYYSKLRGEPTGTKKVVGRGINRPETIESIFYMYRLTGDRKWQEKGWKMFVSWMQTAKVDGGISSIQDVTADQVRFGDNMESFALAETFKYHFLLQSEPDVMSLDDYVLNTEAHPFLVNPKLDPTSSTSHVRYWTPPTSPPDDLASAAALELGVRSQGTNVQKFMRLQILDRARSRLIPQVQGDHPGSRPPGAGAGAGAGSGLAPLHPPQHVPPHGGGGHGMGGGGGDPNFRPKPPTIPNAPTVEEIAAQRIKAGGGENGAPANANANAPGSEDVVRLEFPEDF
ncbi:mannosyl-oligosaccharide 1,2-alpha-mannosidase [Kwoniella heveanensis CBS 569]|nr:mannosyl-oligosaccharide 1,2-alpha-mannosidase [Kwoniella heveanensis CBS 569]